MGAWPSNCSKKRAPNLVMELSLFTRMPPKWNAIGQSDKGDDEEDHERQAGGEVRRQAAAFAVAHHVGAEPRPQRGDCRADDEREDEVLGENGDELCFGWHWTNHK